MLSEEENETKELEHVKDADVIGLTVDFGTRTLAFSKNRVPQATCTFPADVQELYLITHVDYDNDCVELRTIDLVNNKKSLVVTCQEVASDKVRTSLATAAEVRTYFGAQGREAVESRGFEFSEGRLIFPSGHIEVASSTVLSASSGASTDTVRFRVIGNSSFDFGLIPADSPVDNDYLHEKGEYGFKSCGTGGGVLPRLACYDKPVELHVDLKARVLRVRVFEDESWSSVAEEKTQTIRKDGRWRIALGGWSETTYKLWLRSGTVLGGNGGCCVVTKKNFKGESKVVRGPEWKWGQQDGGAGNMGILAKSLDSDGWAEVRWKKSGNSNKYRVKSARDLLYHATDCVCGSTANEGAVFCHFKKGIFPEGRREQNQATIELGHVPYFHSGHAGMKPTTFYHATNEENALRIQEHGFKIPPGPGGLLGRGVYCTATLKKAMDYLKGPYGGVILQLSVDLGRCKQLEPNDTMMTTWQNQFDSAWAPFSAANPCDFEKQENCVKDPKRIKVVQAIAGNTAALSRGGYAIIGGKLCRGRTASGSGSEVHKGFYHPGKREHKGGCVGHCCNCQKPCGGGCGTGHCAGDCKWTCCGATGRKTSWPGCTPAR